MGATPHVVYDALLSSLAQAGYLAIATPYITDLNHHQIACQISEHFQSAVEAIDRPDLPIFGLGHSLGCKLHLLNSCQEAASQSRSRRAGNILMAYSNASFRGELPEWVPAEFDPSPAQTEALIDRDYDFNRTLLVRFDRDTLDDIEGLNRKLARKLGSSLDYQLLSGDHGTSAGGRYPLPTGQEFNPLDAIGQFVYQNLNRENRQLQDILRTWLDCQVQQLP